MRLLEREPSGMQSIKTAVVLCASFCATRLQNSMESMESMETMELTEHREIKGERENRCEITSLYESICSSF